MSTTSPELHSLAAAYACDALEPAERAAFEHHLAQCPSCAREVRALLETASLLALATARTPPAGMKAAVDARLDATAQLEATAELEPAPQAAGTGSEPGAARPGSVSASRSLRHRLLPSLGWGLAAVMAAVIAVLGIRLDDQDNRSAAADRQSAAITALLSAPDARISTAAVTTGGRATALTSHKLDEAAISLTGLADIPPGKTYQLWLIGSASPRSAGLVPSGPHAGAAQPESVIAHGLADAGSIALTVEPAGGSAQPTTEPLVRLQLPPPAAAPTA